jgi:hypothetical protein
MFTRVLHGVHRVDARGPLTPEQRAYAGQLYAGPQSILTGLTSLRPLRLRSLEHEGFAAWSDVHLLVPHTVKRKCAGFVTVERTLELPPYRDRDGLRLAAVSRSVLDAARQCSSPEAVRALVFEVVQRRLTTPQALDRERRLGQVRGSRFARLALEEVFGGARSVPEGDVRAAFEGAGWTRLRYNVTLETVDGRFLAIADVYDELTGVCLEVDSREHHFEVASWEATMRRHGRMTAAGLAVLHVPPSRVTTELEGIVHEFGLAVAARNGWPPPAVRVRRARP